MAIVNLPFTFVNGTTAEGPDVTANDAALRDGVNNVEAAQIVNGTIVASKLDDSVNPVVRYPETGGQQFVVDGDTWITTTTSPDLDYTVPSFVSYVQGVRVTNAGFLRTYSASRDTYIDQDNAGALTFTEVLNGANAPAQAAGTLRLLKIETDATEVTDVVVLSRVTALETNLFFEFKSIECNLSNNTGSPETPGNQEATVIFRGRDSTGEFLLDTGTSGVTFDSAIKLLVNGMDQNIPLMANHWIDIYVIGDSSGQLATGSCGSYNSSPFGTGTPNLPVGYDVYRWVGSLMTTPSPIQFIPSVQAANETVFTLFVKSVFPAANNNTWVLIDFDAINAANADHVGHVYVRGKVSNFGTVGYGHLAIVGATTPASQDGAQVIAQTAAAAVSDQAVQWVPISGAGVGNFWSNSQIDGTSGGGQEGERTPVGLSLIGWRYKHD